MSKSESDERRDQESIKRSAQVRERRRGMKQRPQQLVVFDIRMTKTAREQPPCICFNRPYIKSSYYNSFYGYSSGCYVQYSMVLSLYNIVG